MQPEGGSQFRLAMREAYRENLPKMSARPLMSNFKRLRLLATATQTLLTWILSFLELCQLDENLGFFSRMFNKDLETEILQNPQLS